MKALMIAASFAAAFGLSVVVLVVADAGCAKSEKSAAAEPMEAPPPPPPPPPAPLMEMAKEASGAVADGMMDMKKADKNMAMRGGANRPQKAVARLKSEDAEEKDKAPESPAPGPAQAAPTRAWFPETFLFAPRVITDDGGNANVDVLIPDRLTTWRILALAHSRKGAQAGALTSLVSQLPVSVDVVVPHFLVAGDRVALPFQVTNTTDKALAEALTTKVDGGRLSGVPATLRVDAQSTASATGFLDAPEPGEVVVQASAGAEDSVRRTIAVQSPGRPMHVEQSGTLAAKRTFTMAFPEEAGAPLPGTARASLQVFPGALAILRAELASAPDRTSLYDDAYTLSLVGRARTLSTKLGAPVDDKTITHLQRVAGQRLARWALNPDLFAAMALAPGALASDPDSLVGRNGEHLAQFVARSQRPDGTFGGGEGWPLPRLIAATADGINAVRAGTAGDDGKRRAAAATLRARGAFERFAGQIDDAYTAAVVVATGVVDGDLQAKLREKIVAGLVQKKDGTRALSVPAGALRSDGTTPTEVEATALAVLALHDDPKSTALLPDLGATVLSAYRPGSGFGDGATNRAALDAVALLFAEPLPSKVAVTLTVDGKAVGTDTLEGARLHEVMTLDGAIAAAAKGAAVVVEADPPLPGLSYVLSIDYAVNWPKPAVDAGLTLDVAVKGPLAVGKVADVELRAVAPGGAALHVVQGLPAGVDPVKASLDALVASGVITKFDIVDGVITFDAPARRQGELLDAHYKVVPTLAGALHARVASVSLQSSPSTSVFFPPSTWTIAK